MSLRRVSFLVAVALASGLPVVPAHTWHPEVVLVDETFSGPGWIAVRFTSPGPTYHLSVSGVAATQGILGIMLLDKDLNRITTSIVLQEESFVDAWAHSSLVPEARPAFETYEGWNKESLTIHAGIEGGCTCFPPGAGTFTAIAWAAGDAMDWTFTLTAPASTTLEGITEGASTFLYRSPDFEAPFAAKAAMGYGVEAHIQARMGLQTDGALIGVFTATSEGDSRTTMRLDMTTEDATQACPCSFHLPATGGMRTLEFTANGAVVNVNSRDTLILTGALVTLPP